MKNIKLTLFILSLLLSSTFAMAETQSTSIKYSTSASDSFFQKIWAGLKNLGTTQQTVLVGEKGELTVGQESSVLFTFFADCPTGNNLQGILVATDPNGKIVFNKDVSSTVNCQEQRNIRITFTPLIAGVYVFNYRLTDLTSSQPVPIDSDGDGTNDVLNGELVSIVAIAKTPIFSPYCTIVNTINLYDSNQKVGSASEKRCYTNPGIFKTEVIVNCNQGYQPNLKGGDKTLVENWQCQKIEQPKETTDIFSQAPSGVVENGVTSCGDGICSTGEDSVSCTIDCVFLTADECEIEGDLLTIDCFQKTKPSVAVSSCVNTPDGLKVQNEANKCPVCTSSTQCVGGYSCIEGSCVSEADDDARQVYSQQITSFTSKNTAMVVIALMLFIIFVILAISRFSQKKSQGRTKK